MSPAALSLPSIFKPMLVVCLTPVASLFRVWSCPSSDSHPLRVPPHPQATQQDRLGAFGVTFSLRFLPRQVSDVSLRGLGWETVSTSDHFSQIKVLPFPLTLQLHSWEPTHCSHFHPYCLSSQWTQLRVDSAQGLRENYPCPKLLTAGNKRLPSEACKAGCGDTTELTKEACFFWEDSILTAREYSWWGHQPQTKTLTSKCFFLNFF
jgi:hypothetical protein